MAYPPLELYRAEFYGAVVAPPASTPNSGLMGTLQSSSSHCLMLETSYPGTKGGEQVILLGSLYTVDVLPKSNA